MVDVDIVVHFAAETHVDRSLLDPDIFIKTNIIGTEVLCRAALKAKLSVFTTFLPTRFWRLVIDNERQI